MMANCEGAIVTPGGSDILGSILALSDGVRKVFFFLSLFLHDAAIREEGDKVIIRREGRNVFVHVRYEGE